MKLDELHRSLAAGLHVTVNAAPRGTVLGTLAGKIRLMAGSYESDGLTFLASGDEVNALAGFWYAFGWLHFGYAYGLLIGPLPPGCPVPGSSVPLSPECRPALDEKAHRYLRLLRTAGSSVNCGPERETDAGEFANRVLFIANIFEAQGERYLISGRNEDALACFSYGHGWLDAAVTSGLFRIVADRDLFTV
jgi:uncharacterized protein